MKSEATPAPAKEVFFALQHTLTGVEDISLYVGDHTLSLAAEGLAFDKLFLPKDQLLALDTDDMGAGGFLADMFNMKNPWISAPEVRTLFIGLDAGGKTTILYKLKLGEVVTTIPTIGFNVESVKYKNISFTIWDVGGQQQIRPLWRHYLANTQAVVYIIDSNDSERMQEAHDELHKMLDEPELNEAVLLVLANKQDLPNAKSVAEVTDKLGLHSLRNRRWYIQACCGVSGDGLYEGLDWLAASFQK